MKVIIAGSRRFPTMGILKPKDWQGEAERVMAELLAETVVSAKFEISTVVSGTCWGIDRLGEKYAAEKNLPVEPFPAKWESGRGAGFARNAEMAQFADALIAIMSEGSSGTRDMIDQMKKLKKPFFAVVIG